MQFCQQRMRELWEIHSKSKICHYYKKNKRDFCGSTILLLRLHTRNFQRAIKWGRISIRIFLLRSLFMVQIFLLDQLSIFHSANIWTYLTFFLEVMAQFLKIPPNKKVYKGSWQSNFSNPICRNIKSFESFRFHCDFLLEIGNVL